MLIKCFYNKYFSSGNTHYNRNISIYSFLFSIIIQFMYLILEKNNIFLNDSALNLKKNYIKSIYDELLNNCIIIFN